MKKENLLIVISTANKNTILKFPLLYGRVSLPRDYWEKLHIMFWGDSIDTLSKDKELQQMVLEVQQTGVEFSACIVCADEYGAVETLESLGITCNHTGYFLTEALKSNEWATLTI